MRYLKSFAAAFTVALAAFVATPAQSVTPTDASVIFFDEEGDIDEVWIIDGGDWIIV
jgi:hypothetical protein